MHLGRRTGDISIYRMNIHTYRKTEEVKIKVYNELTVTLFSDGESTLDKGSKDKFNQRSLKPHEKRALNFLINEYLLMQDYKLTSITFSDENPDQVRIFL